MKANEESFIADFARHLENAERSPCTIKSYTHDLRAFAKWFQDTNSEGLTPTSITPTDLRKYKQELLKQRKKPKTVNRKLATLNSFLKWAIKAGHMPDGRQPAMPGSVREVNPGPRWLDKNEKYALVRTIEKYGDQRDIAIVKLLLNTGLRVQELCSLTWQDVWLSDRKGGLTVTGKGRKQRQIPLNKDARNALALLDNCGSEKENTAILQGQRGPLTPRGVQIMLKKYGRLAGLENVTPHTLRHTFCKEVLDSGRNLYEVAALAGHESLDTTRLYCEPSLKELEFAVAAIEEG